jgi:type VI secretion system protein ImpA
MLEKKNLDIMKPISVKAPYGTDLRTDADSQIIYYKIKNARRTARDIERYNLTNEDQKNPHPTWKLVIDLIENCLINHCKDFELACWLCEAWTREYNLKGLYYGLKLLHDLLKNFSYNIHPIDEATQKTSLQSFINLNGNDQPGTLPNAINKMIVINDNNKQLTKSNLHCLTDISSIKSAEEIHLICHKVDSKALISIKQTVDNTFKCYSELCDLIMQQSFAQEIPTSNIKNSLIETIDFMQAILTKKGGNVKTIHSDNITDSHESDTKDTSLQETGSTSLHIDRLEAISMISESAKYFQQNEPHSPIPFLLEKAKRWASMSLPELLEEIVLDESEKKNIYKLTGIN